MKHVMMIAALGVLLAAATVATAQGPGAPAAKPTPPAAKSYYEKSERMAAANPALRARLMQGVAKRFKGTHFGDRAAEELGGGKP